MLAALGTMENAVQLIAYHVPDVIELTFSVFSLSMILASSLKQGFTLRLNSFRCL
jgi:hypothetical protein